MVSRKGGTKDLYAFAKPNLCAHRHWMGCRVVSRHDWYHRSKTARILWNMCSFFVWSELSIDFQHALQASNAGTKHFRHIMRLHSTRCEHIERISLKFIDLLTPNLVATIIIKWYTICIYSLCALWISWKIVVNWIDVFTLTRDVRCLIWYYCFRSNRARVCVLACMYTSEREK